MVPPRPPKITNRTPATSNPAKKTAASPEGVDRLSATLRSISWEAGSEVPAIDSCIRALIIERICERPLELRSPSPVSKAFTRMANAPADAPMRNPCAGITSPWTRRRYRVRAIPPEANMHRQRTPNDPVAAPKFESRPPKTPANSSAGHPRRHWIPFGVGGGTGRHGDVCTCTGSAGGCTSSGVPGVSGGVTGWLSAECEVASSDVPPTDTRICGALQFGQNGIPFSTAAPHLGQG